MIEAYYKEKNIELYNLNILDGIPLPDNHVDCIMTSPPYWGLRDYGEEGQIGLEPTLQEYLEHMLFVTAECKRVLKPTGVMFWNHGDCYGGAQGRGYGKGNEHGQMKSQKTSMPKCMLLQNYRLIIRMIDEQGWILRNDIKWIKPNSMPSSVKDRFSNNYEPMFMLVKSQKYWFDLDAVRIPLTSSGYEQFNRRVRDVKKGKIAGPDYKASEKEIRESNRKGIKVAGQTPQGMHRKRHSGYFDNEGNCLVNPAGKNPGDVWTIPTQPFPMAHFATFPEKLVENPAKAGCPKEICKKCGKAKERIIEEGDLINPDNMQNINQDERDEKEEGWNREAGFSPNCFRDRKTIGWTDCKCNAGFKPGIVFDPFHGSGTTGKVALKLGRQYIGIDIKKEYLDMSLKTRLKDRYLNL